MFEWIKWNVYMLQFTQTLSHTAHVCTFVINTVFVDTKAFFCNSNVLLAIQIWEELIYWSIGNVLTGLQRFLTHGSNRFSETYVMLK